MLSVRNLSYTHVNKDVLFEDIHLTVNHLDKIALVGKNGVGKSTLLRLIAGELQPSGGHITADTTPYYVPQSFGQFNHLSISQALRVDDKLRALSTILAGDLTEEDYVILDDDWSIEERCFESLRYWGLQDLDLSHPLGSLSGGQKTKVFLAGVSIHQPKLILLDEPSNHLDLTGRQLLYDFIQSTHASCIVVSHDRTLLNQFNVICELNSNGITVYGGNYDFYAEQKQIQLNALDHDIQSKNRSLKEARKKQRDAQERKQKLDARGKKKQVKAGMPKSMMHKMRNDAQNSSAKLKGVHANKMDTITRELHDLRATLPEIDKIKFGFNDSALHQGKVLVHAADINFSYNTHPIWPQGLSFRIESGERIALKGRNGSGKTTLIKMILGSITPQKGILKRADMKPIYIDQDYSLIDSALTIYEQAERFNVSALKEHEIKIKLDRFLFPRDTWDKPCEALSGGERMRLVLCCLTVHQQAPDLIILDEPTNNLDLQNIEILARVVKMYEGTLVVVSHDERFLEEVGIQRVIALG